MVIGQVFKLADDTKIFRRIKDGYSSKTQKD